MLVFQLVAALDGRTIIPASIIIGSVSPAVGFIACGMWKGWAFCRRRWKSLAFYYLFAALFLVGVISNVQELQWLEWIGCSFMVLTMLFGPLLAFSFLVSAADVQRYPAGHCLQCGYDLHGNTTGRCPECGAAA